MCHNLFIFSIFNCTQVQFFIFYLFIFGLIFEIHINSCLIGFVHRSLFYLGQQLGKRKVVLKEGNHTSGGREINQRVQKTVSLSIRVLNFMVGESCEKAGTLLCLEWRRGY